MTSGVRAEISELMSGRVGIADGIIPPAIFVTINSIWGLSPAAWAGIGSAVAITLFRLTRRRPVRFAFGGLLGTVIAVGLALRTDSAADYFLPGIISGSISTVVLLASVPLRRPAVAYTSWITRGWPIDWYWHPQVRPAYAKATLLWVGFFGSRTAVQWRLFLDGEVEWLGAVRVVLGWPALFGLLVATYVLGRRWLTELDGPSVDEFEAGVAPPWEGQAAGF